MSTPDSEEVVTPTEVIAKPEARVRGRFALFDTPDGGLHVAYRPDGAEEDEHITVPGHIMKVAKMLSEGNISPTAVLKMMKGM